jgi:hypothetical protein
MPSVKATSILTLYFDAFLLIFFKKAYFDDNQEAEFFKTILLTAFRFCMKSLIEGKLVIYNG